MWFWITLALAVATNLIQAIAGTDSTIGNAIVMILAIVEIVVGIIALYKLSKSFGHGVGFTIGLILLAPIFLLILAFGSSKYIGPEGKTQGSIAD